MDQIQIVETDLRTGAMMTARFIKVRELCQYRPHYIVHNLYRSETTSSRSMALSCSLQKLTN
jgi:hypothetical protein